MPVRLSEQPDSECQTGTHTLTIRKGLHMVLWTEGALPSSSLCCHTHVEVGEGSEAGHSILLPSYFCSPYRKPVGHQAMYHGVSNNGTIRARLWGRPGHSKIGRCDVRYADIPWW